MHSAVVVFSLTVGIWLVLVTFSTLGARWRRPEMVDPDRLVVVMETASRDCRDFCAPDLFTATTFRMWQEAHPPSFVSLAAYEQVNVDLDRPQVEDPVPAARVGPEFFSTLGVRPAAGRLIDSDDCSGAADPVVVLSHGVWRRLFGASRSAIGSHVVAHGRTYVVIGIMQRGFAYPDGTELWLGCDPSRAEAASGTHYLAAVGRLYATATRNSAQRDLETIADRAGTEIASEEERRGVYVRPLEQWMAAESGPGEWVVVGAIWLAFLVALANVASLSLVRALRREREVAIRSALGARLGQVASLLLTETLILTGASAGLGLVLATLTVGRISLILRQHLGSTADLTVSAGVVLAAVVLAIGAGVVLGLAPMRHLRRADPATLLRSGGLGSTGRSSQSRERKALLVGEIMLVVALCSGALLFFRAYLTSVSIDMGFDVDEVLVAMPRLDRQELGKQPGVSAIELLERLNVTSPGNRVAIMMEVVSPTRPKWDGDRLREPVVTIEGRDESLADDMLDKQSIPYVLDVTPGFISILGFSLLRGRDFTAQDMGQMQEAVIVNEAAARHYWPGSDPIGMRIKLGPASSSSPWYTVIGVASGTKLPHHWGRDLAALNPGRNWAVVYRPVSKGYVSDASGWSDFRVVARKHHLSPGYIPDLRAAIQGVFGSSTSTRFATFSTMIRDESIYTRDVRLRVVLLSVLTLAALLLAFTGIYALIMEAVQQRRREIGIRIALGASPPAVLSTILREAALVTATGVLAGTVLVVLVIAFAGRTIFGFREMLLFGTSASDPWPYAGVLLVLALLVTSASVFPALRALSVDPVNSLRAE